MSQGLQQMLTVATYWRRLGRDHPQYADLSAEWRERWLTRALRQRQVERHGVPGSRAAWHDGVRASNRED